MGELTAIQAPPVVGVNAAEYAVLPEDTVNVCVAVETEEPIIQVNAVSVLGVVLRVGCAFTVKLTGMLKGELDAEESVMTTLPA